MVRFNSCLCLILKIMPMPQGQSISNALNTFPEVPVVKHVPVPVVKHVHVPYPVEKIVKVPYPVERIVEKIRHVPYPVEKVVSG